jgi:hypothetical protein
MLRVRGTCHQAIYIAARPGPSTNLNAHATARVQTHTHTDCQTDRQTDTHAHARTHTHACTRSLARARTHTRTHARTHTRKHARTRTRTHMLTCTHMHTPAPHTPHATRAGNLHAVREQLHGRSDRPDALVGAADARVGQGAAHDLPVLIEVKPAVPRARVPRRARAACSMHAVGRCDGGRVRGWVSG